MNFIVIIIIIIDNYSFCLFCTELTDMKIKLFVLSKQMLVLFVFVLTKIHIKVRDICFVRSKNLFC